MHEHNPDLIAAVAENTLSGEEAAAARAEISGCARCTADLAAQQSALAAMATAPSPTLTGDESQVMRAAIASALGLEPAPSPAAQQPRRRVPWTSLAVAAASLIALVTVVPNLGLLSANDGDASAATTIAPAAESAGDAIQEDTARTAERFEGATTTTIAGETTTTDVGVAAAPGFESFDDASLSLYYESAGAGFGLTNVEDIDESEVPCSSEVDELVAPAPEVSKRLIFFDEVLAILVVERDEDGSIRELNVVDTDTCTVIRTLP